MPAPAPVTRMTRSFAASASGWYAGIVSIFDMTISLKHEQDKQDWKSVVQRRAKPLRKIPACRPRATPRGPETSKTVAFDRPGGEHDSGIAAHASVVPLCQ